MNFETVIGLEIHAQLKTKSKLFSSSSCAFGSNPNTSANFVDAGLPGTLPVLNKQAVLFAIKFGLAINAKINDLSYFERKNYFYPDLPKGYQISQSRRPIIGSGYIDIDNKKGVSKRVVIDHAHLEEDAGKSTHNTPSNFTSIDLNRSGNPLLEIVTTPCMHSAKEAVDFLKHLHTLLRFLEICDGNMQEGSFRCDVNISLRKPGEETLGTRTELKNINSFRYIEKAIKFEQERHQDILESGEVVIQQTRLYSPDTNTTHPMRDKENENDYRYFPDPDLLPIKITEEMLKDTKEKMPKLPSEIKENLISNDELSNEDADFLLTTVNHLQFYNLVKKLTKANNKVILNWLKGIYTASLHEHGLSFENPPVSANDLGCLLDKLTNNNISQAVAKTIFLKLISSDMSVDEIIAKENYQPMCDEATLIKIIDEIIERNPLQVSQYKSGKTKLLGFFVGLVMKKTQGQASAQIVSELLCKHLGSM
ncbi:MAG: Asp-tRNA(Asn)/Glu-tRNA(Gln) amidotransferase subunit GatB [Legionellaceae bacterium]|nr:Asp-tRNA(Asn)/Glu-tRNA(Gln) amidotransferase subunit GatB [Legionellaceae bacterium]